MIQHERIMAFWQNRAPQNHNYELILKTGNYLEHWCLKYGGDTDWKWHKVNTEPICPGIVGLPAIFQNQAPGDNDYEVVGRVNNHLEHWYFRSASTEWLFASRFGENIVGDPVMFQNKAPENYNYELMAQVGDHLEHWFFQYGGVPSTAWTWHKASTNPICPGLINAPAVFQNQAPYNHNYELVAQVNDHLEHWFFRFGGENSSAWNWHLADTFALEPSTTAANPNALPSVKAQLEFLYAEMGKRIITGQFGSYGEGQTLSTANAQLESIYKATGKYPAMTGYDLQSPDRTLETQIAEAEQYVREKWAKGYIINLSMHMRNPSTGGDSHDSPYDIARAYLPSGDGHQRYRTTLDVVAALFKRLENDGIAVIYRPFHEMNGSWFWWGNQPEEFRAMWIDLFDYMTYTKDCRNLLWCWSPNYSYTSKVWQYYPGDKYVDILGIDWYLNKDFYGQNLWSVIDNTYSELSIAQTYKPIMLMEFGASEAEWPPTINTQFNWKVDFFNMLRTQAPRVVGFQAWEGVWQIVDPKSAYKGASEMMNDPRAITLDHLPNWQAQVFVEASPDLLSNSPIAFRR